MGEEIGFVGLGNMGLPMARRLLEAGHRVRGFDAAPAARARFAALDGAVAAGDAAQAAAGAGVLVLMLPTSAVVRAVLVDDGALEALPAGATVVDMSSSEPLETRELARLAARRGVALVDAPVSGGVRGAEAGTLTIMAGGPADRVEAVRPLLDALGSRIVHAGEVGAGHALKAINNLLSATHLLASSEALRIGRAFGLDPARMLEAINGSSGRSWSTEHKLPDFVLTETYASGFGLRLMVKDMGIACALGERLGAAPALGARALELWERAAGALPAGADHTEIARWVDGGEP